MKIITNKQQLLKYTKNLNKTIGFVPTMGALHEGHLSLIKQARVENEIIIVSIFVNPTQFLADEDLDKYPSKNGADIKICELASVDILFMPNISEMYEKDEIRVIAPKTKGYILEGESRPGHFDGVLQIVLKLFNLINPTNAYFGKKDAQQLSLIKQMCKNFYLDINIIECEIVRDENGLALSSRNVYLNKEEKKEALKISRSLKDATKLILAGKLDIGSIISKMNNTLKGIDVEYIKVLTRDFKEIKSCQIGNTIIMVAARVGKTRLIDNIWI